MLIRTVLSLFTVTVMSWSASGASVYKVCVGCHGARGEKSAVGVSKVIQGQNVALTVKQLKAYRAGTLNQYGMGNLMNKYAKRLSDAQIKAVARYIANLR
jgi:cytochrome c553